MFLPTQTISIHSQSIPAIAMLVYFTKLNRLYMDRRVGKEELVFLGVDADVSEKLREGNLFLESIMK